MVESFAPVTQGDVVILCHLCVLSPILAQSAARHCEQLLDLWRPWDTAVADRGEACERFMVVVAWDFQKLLGCDVWELEGELCEVGSMVLRDDGFWGQTFSD